MVFGKSAKQQLSDALTNYVPEDNAYENFYKAMLQPGGNPDITLQGSPVTRGGQTFKPNASDMAAAVGREQRANLGELSRQHAKATEPGAISTFISELLRPGQSIQPGEEPAFDPTLAIEMQKQKAFADLLQNAPRTKPLKKRVVEMQKKNKMSQADVEQALQMELFNKGIVPQTQNTPSAGESDYADIFRRALASLR